MRIISCSFISGPLKTKSLACGLGLIPVTHLPQGYHAHSWRYCDGELPRDGKLKGLGSLRQHGPPDDSAVQPAQLGIPGGGGGG